MVDKRVVEPAKTVVKHVSGAVNETAVLLKQSGPLAPGSGLASGVLAFSLAFLSLLGVAAFHFPQYLTTPELRREYDPDVIRHIMFAALVIAGSISLLNVLFKRERALNAIAGLMVIGAVAAGGSHVPVNDFPDHTPYIGLDWFILDLLGSTVIFAAIEKLFPLYKGQLLFRREWQTDMVHFAVNHFIVGLALLTVNFAIHRLFGWMVNDTVHGFVKAIPFIPQLLLCILVADLVQYWTHRSYHEIPFLWRFHAVHHSAKTMDWLAGSRQHILELLCTRVGVLGALYVLGFDKEVMDVYIIVVGFQAVFNHANVHLPWGPLKYIIVTPDFHHWHHSSDDVAIDRNYAAHYAFLDHLFGTAIKGQKGFPEKYGVQGDYMPDGFINQLLFPFRSQK
ncbi:sterol desaturase family protein [Duganella sp. FT92W]|uniref:Sterol desaturase family protein n=1 Tax=Pseudoduganella rivuli TaxID=2666085 RepID=A0A7X2IL19_9BURK|nr:sterol desaturase family protein [Pseudoduganella rivuli]MRV71799.1 sterol desaturase family protein [Pseudoduganella rivuli]